VNSLFAIFWFALLILLMHALRDVYGPLLQRRIVKLAMAPGIVVFLFFKILTCYVAGARVKEIKPFDDKAKLLDYEKPTLGPVGEFLIAVLPLLCLLVTFALLYSLLAMRILYTIPDLPRVPLLWRAPGSFFAGFVDFLVGFLKTSYAAGSWWAFWILVYGAVNVLLAGAPPLKDLKYMAVALGIGALVLLGLDSFRVHIGSPEVRNFVRRFASSFRFMLGAGLGWIFVSIFIVGAWRLLGQNRQERK